MQASQYHKGDVVVFAEMKAHDIEPRYFPLPGTVGTIITADSDGTSLVQWESGSTSCEDRWWCRNSYLELDQPLKFDNFKAGELEALF